MQRAWSSNGDARARGGNDAFQKLKTPQRLTRMFERAQAIKAFRALRSKAYSMPCGGRQQKMAKGARFQYHGCPGAVPPAQVSHGPGRVVPLPS